jgi:3-hydroxyacyl-CoA dehydrogenase
VSAAAGFQVTIVDVKEEFLNKATSTISTSLGRMMKKTITDEKELAAKRDEVSPK